MEGHSEPVDQSESINVDSKNNVDVKQHGTQKRTGTVLGSIFNMANTVLAFPFTYEESGLVFGIILTVVVVILSGLSMHIIVACAKLDPKARSYQDVIRLYMGELWVKISELLFIANLVGANICFLVIIGDSIQPVLAHYIGEDFYLCDRKVVIIIMGCVVVFPLILLREVKKLEFSSTIALAGVIYLLFMTLIECIIFWSSGNPLNPGVMDKMFLNREVYVGIPKAIISIPIIALSFQGIEIICVPIYYEIKKPSLLKMDIIIFSSMFLSASIYVVVGIFGFLRFGSGVDANILLSFGGDNIPASVARFLIGLTVTLSYPLIFFAVRLAIHSFVVSVRKNAKHDSEIPTTEFAIVSVVVHGITVVVALFIPDIGDVFGIVGSFGSITFVFLFPLALLWIVVTREYKKGKMKTWQKYVAYVFIIICMILSAIVLVMGIGVTVLKMVVEARGKKKRHH